MGSFIPASPVSEWLTKPLPLLLPGVGGAEVPVAAAVAPPLGARPSVARTAAGSWLRPSPGFAGRHCAGPAGSAPNHGCRHRHHHTAAAAADAAAYRR